ncbi:MAG: ABC transporter ATP-binding protein [Planctomycetota bacterium]|jgi:branched-chain amino acid transport system ATP-binding protein
MLRVTNLHHKYGQVYSLKGIDLEVNAGEIVALIGANGAGKTTLLRCISGMLKSSSGRIEFLRQDITNCPAHVISKKGVGHVLEGRHVFPHLTVMENLMIGAYLRRDKELNADIDQVFELFPRLKERITQNAGTLSGGEQQMLAMSRMLMSKPKLAIMDEPSLGLAPIFIECIFDVIQKIAKESTTILLVEQNAQLALEIADRGYVIELGKIVLSDTGSNLLGDENVRKSYLGEN